ncbi:hypothetical protein B0T11DRAFT_316356 [Plectosphaerella cucumerina]|uniref:Uncharacterized protein n=1 Tax=Plectosphaerella cucumerina TaxID=40658 RepID=A0A8K0TRF8_9PEZI|nr:hypothetical protein B0T11DRAFT_316356 [Plectosphaerella cucumerina]
MAASSGVSQLQYPRTGWRWRLRACSGGGEARNLGGIHPLQMFPCRSWMQDLRLVRRYYQREVDLMHVVSNPEQHKTITPSHQMQVVSGTPLGTCARKVSNQRRCHNSSWGSGSRSRDGSGGFGAEARTLEGFRASGRANREHFNLDRIKYRPRLVRSARGGIIRYDHLDSSSLLDSGRELQRARFVSSSTLAQTAMQVVLTDEVWRERWMGWVCISKAVPSSLSNYHVAGLTRSL